MPKIKSRTVYIDKFPETALRKLRQMAADAGVLGPTPSNPQTVRWAALAYLEAAEVKESIRADQG